MNAQFASLISFVGLSLALSWFGPADASVALTVIGGLPDCNHSDYLAFDCVEINGRKTSCMNAEIGAETVQGCKDILVQSGQICTETNCENKTKDVYKGSAPTACRAVGCGS